MGRTLATLLLAALAAVPVATPAPAQPLRVMVVGDSITHGRSADDPWRCRLYRTLAEQRPVDMVGTRSDLYGAPDGSSRYLADCDPDHAAYWGRLLAAAADTIRADVTTARPDVVLVLAGVNDINLGHSTERVAADFRRFVTEARAGRPDVAIVAGTVLPTVGVVDQTRIDAYNRWLWQHAAELDVTLATTAAAIDPAADLYDGVHPNERGAQRIAGAFLAAVPAV